MKATPIRFSLRHINWQRRLLRVPALVAGITLMVGTRPAMISAVLVALVLMVCGALAARTRHGRPAVAEVVIGVAAAAALLVAAYPHVFAHPGLLVQSMQQSASFRDNNGAGYLYVPFHLVAQFHLCYQCMPQRPDTGIGHKFFCRLI